MSTPLEIAEAALEKVHAAEAHVDVAAPAEPVKPVEEDAKHLDMGPTYLGPTAINGS